MLFISSGIVADSRFMVNFAAVLACLAISVSFLFHHRSARSNRQRSLGFRTFPAFASFAACVLAWGCGSGTSAAMILGPESTGVDTGVSATANAQVLGLTASSLNFQYVALNSVSTQTITLSSKGTQPLAIKSISVMGSGFSVSGISLPLTLKPHQTATLTAHFAPTTIGGASGQISISASSGNTAVKLSGTGGVPPLTAFYCATGTPTVSATTDICTVKIPAASTSGPVTVNLASNASAITVPATVSIPANATAVQFKANLNSVQRGQSVTLSALCGGTTMTTAVKLTGTWQALAVSTSSLNYQYVPLNTSSALNVTLTSTGEQPVTVTSLGVTGTGFSVSGAALPLTLKPNQSATFTARFTPTVTGSANGQIKIVNTRTAGTAATVALSGNGGVPPLSSFYCVTGTPVGETTDICTVKFNGVSPGAPFLVNLASSSTSVTVPQTISVTPNWTSAQFTVSVHAVSAAQNVTLTARTAADSMASPIKLSPYVASLGLSRASVAFSNVPVNTSATQTLTLNSVGTAPVRITGVVLTGAKFKLSGPSVPLVLNAGQSAALSIEFDPTTAGTATGLITVTSNSTGTGTSQISLSGLALRSSNAFGSTASFDYTASPVVGRFSPPDENAAITRDAYGMTIHNLTPNSLYPAPNMTPYPSASISTLRGISHWAWVDSYPEQNNWTQTDKTIAMAQEHGGADVIYTFGRPAPWASTNPTDPCTGGDGPGTCDPPDMAAFEAFAVKFVQRYCGKIKYYEPWNEPDNPQFWVGTNTQMLNISRITYKVVKDPANCGCTEGSCKPGGGANPNKVLLPPISNPFSGQGLAWLNSYLHDAGAGYLYADIIGFHGYLWPGADAEKIVSEMQDFKQTLQTYGLSNLPVWNTEASWENNVNLTSQQQANWVFRYHALMTALGVSKTVWFAYDNCSWGTLYNSPLCPNPGLTVGEMGTLTAAGKAYLTMQQWLIGAVMTECVQYQNGLWICHLQRSGGYDAWLVWNSGTQNITLPVPGELGLTVMRDSQNHLSTVGTQIAVTQEPMLLETIDQM